MFEAVNRSPPSPETLDGTLRPLGEEYKPTLGSDEDDEDEYQKLVESINKHVIDSSCVEDPEDSGVPLELYIHQFLEHVCNYRGANIQCHTWHLPTHALPIRTYKPGTSVSGSQTSSGAGQEGNGGNKKRKKRGNIGPGRGGKDQNSPYDDGGDDIGDNTGTDRFKKQKTGMKLSCPFRKRNPLRFNVRDYYNCALVSYQSIALLK